MEIRELERQEIERVREIDRRELIEGIYYHRDGKLVLEPERYDVEGWPAGALDGHLESLRACSDAGGTIYGAFDAEGRLVGVASVGNRFFGRANDRLQLEFFHVSYGSRGKGLGTTLFERAADRARELGGKVLYVSAMPSENTVSFYMRRGCRLAEEVDPELFDREPEDIHLEFPLDS